MINIEDNFKNQHKVMKIEYNGDEKFSIHGKLDRKKTWVLTWQVDYTLFTLVTFL